MGVVAEAIGKDIPHGHHAVNAAYVQHRQFERSVRELRAMDVPVLYGDCGVVPNPAGARVGKSLAGELLDRIEHQVPRVDLGVALAGHCRCG